MKVTLGYVKNGSNLEFMIGGGGKGQWGCGGGRADGRLCPIDYEESLKVSKGVGEGAPAENSFGLSSK